MEEENPPEFVEEACRGCPWSEEIDPALEKLLYYMTLQDAGCPLERHEMIDPEWQALALLKSERARMAGEKGKE